MKKDKIIFLDIDGILNSTKYLNSLTNKETILVKFSPLDPKAINLINKLIKETSAKIVLTSTWRIYYSLEILIQHLKEAGLDGEIIDTTPKLHFNNADEQSVPKGSEIQVWINEHYKNNKEQLNYVILDDNKDMLITQLDNFIHVNEEKGINPYLITKAIQILNES